ncbi:Flagellar hook-basal body complex protein fliE [Desulfovibrio sp. X2]|uniref:flagellar hook-basal body complex protein FliE n=1 Tax=Desulfovibrio sp. X2 TaxID=941449 RepID=UPI000358BC61|nr:flagellar hook-basal body complex protein FliE [Desulfovibrio sp. X2]EPR44303.1 Flagellar hook-basal body complex protein fliE [Desulfovibrio sp. X2]
MAITAIGSAALKAYGQNIQSMQQSRQKIESQMPQKTAKTEDFSTTLTDSLKEVNQMQIHGQNMVEEFATGKETNVHELMIQLQKANLAVNLTSAVRNKIMSAYQEMMKIQM